jgi:hypothetical protein
LLPLLALLLLLLLLLWSDLENRTVHFAPYSSSQSTRQ